MEVYEIMQYCEVSGVAGAYNRERFIQAVTELPEAEFNKFCLEYLHLLEFYHSTKNFYVADDLDFIRMHPAFFAKIEPIDFNSPVNFARRK